MKKAFIKARANIIQAAHATHNMLFAKNNSGVNCDESAKLLVATAYIPNGNTMLHCMGL